MTLWLNQRLLLSVDGPDGQSQVNIDQPFLRVGSDPAADLVLNGDGVSRRSAYLHGTPFGVYAVILQGSSHGPYPPEYWLSPGRSVQVGPYRLSATLEDQPSGPLPKGGLVAWGSAPLPRPVVDIYHAKKRLGKRHFSASLNLIGRKYQCALQLKGQNVSEFHCAMYWHAEQLWCIDLNSSNGTLLNGRRIIADEIHIGDDLEVGDFNLIFRRLSHSGGRASSAVIPAFPADVGSSATLTDILSRPPVTINPLVSAAEDSGPAGNVDSGRDAGPPRQRWAEAESDVGMTAPAPQPDPMPAGWHEAFQKLAAEQEQLRAQIEQLAVERRALELEREEFNHEAKQRLEINPPVDEAPVAAQPSTGEESPCVPENASEPELVGDSPWSPAASSALQVPLPQDPEPSASDASVAPLAEASPQQKSTSVRRINRDELATMVLDRLERPRPSLLRWLLFSGLLVLAIIATVAIAWLVYTNMDLFSSK